MATGFPSVEGIGAVWEKRVPPLLERASVPGLAAAIVAEGGVAWNRAFGVRHVESPQPVDDHTVFLAGSLSKPVFACAVLHAVESGQLDLDLDVPLRRYLAAPYVADDPAIDLISARMVLSHTTGLPNWRGGDPLRVLRRPGEAFGYSGEGYVYLQRVVEHLTGQSADGYARRIVLAPLGMGSSGYVWVPEYEKTAAAGHDDAGLPVETWKPQEANVAGSLHSTALELARVLAEMLAPDAERVLLSQAVVERMLAPQVRLASKLEWGLGWGLQDTAHGPALWHWGDSAGFKVFAVGFRRAGTGLVILTNGDGGREVYQELLRPAYGDDWPAFDMLDSLGDYLL